MRLVKIRGRKGAADLPTIIVGFLIVIFILIIYIAVTTFLVVKGGFNVFKEANVDVDGVNLVETESIIAFLNVPVDNNAPFGEKNIREIVINAGKEEDNERAKIFKQEAQKFFLIFKDFKYAAWFNIYDKDDKIAGIVSPYPRYYALGNNVDIWTRGDCLPEAPDAELTVFFVAPNKKIALCFESFKNAN